MFIQNNLFTSAILLAVLQNQVSGTPIQNSKCPQKANLVFADMHDGDSKRVYFHGSEIEIYPYDNEEEWKVVATMNTDDCTAIIDFNVAGKPSPPPFKLKAKFWTMISYDSQIKPLVEFTKVDEKFPLNHWVFTKTAKSDNPKKIETVENQ
eukprot:Pgem_evm1s14371